MALVDPDSPGYRIKRLRKRADLSQQDLADKIDRTQGWVSKVESGSVQIDSVNLLNRVARALKAHPNEITGSPYHGRTAAEERAYTAVPELTRQLRRMKLPAESDVHRPIPELVAALAELTGYRGTASYAQLAQDSVPLLAEVHAAYEHAPTSHDREMAYGLFAFVAKEVHSAAYGLGFAEIVAHAENAVRWAAERSDDPNLLIVADYLSARDYWATDDHRDAMYVLDRAASELQAAAERGDSAAASLYGSIHLRAAVTAARDGNAHEAYERLDLAQEVLNWGPQADPYTMWWSSGNVSIHRVGVAVELNDATEVVRRSRGATLPADLPPSRLAHYYLDVARGYTWQGEIDRALGAMERAERIAPELVRNHPMAHAAVQQLFHLERMSTRDRLRGLANRFHVK